VEWTCQEFVVIWISALVQRRKMQVLSAALACGLCVWAFNTSIAQTGVRADPATVARGAKLYENNCVSCHRKDGVGEPRVPWSIRRPGLIEAMPLNETSHAWHHSDEQIVATIMDGNRRSRRRMPAFRNVLSMQDATDLVAYLKSLWSDRIVACQGPKHMRCM
jgi:mono/diheme cytochrome c family protein